MAALKVWFRDDLEFLLRSLTATVLAGNGHGQLSEFQRGQLSALCSVGVAFGLDQDSIGRTMTSGVPDTGIKVMSRDKT